MPPRKKTKQIEEFGDFQTPYSLARDACDVLSRLQVKPATIIEPTCGEGSFLLAALDAFSSAEQVLGRDINPAYVDVTARLLADHPQGGKARVAQADFFSTDWAGLLAACAEPILIIGNPPWVTNSGLGVLGSSNLPEKSNFHRYAGLDAITGKSNFDISEWMLIQLLECLDSRTATLAMLCKTAVARKVLVHAWKRQLNVGSAALYGIDAAKHFSAAVDACLLVCQFAPGSRSLDCDVCSELANADRNRSLGYRDGRLLADVGAYERLKHLRGREVYRWRSGVKHDCSGVMEFREEGGRLVNADGEVVEIETEYLFPMLKSSEVANGSTEHPTRWMLVTQKTVGEDTSVIERTAPKTWEYLNRHAGRLDKRGSAIYKNRPRFSVFGVGEYSFAPFKVAISGFYKRLAFAEIGNLEGKPIVLDDTSYFVPCHSRREADLIAAMLNSDLAREFYSAFVFWDAKRPITIDILRQLSLSALAKELQLEREFLAHLKRHPKAEKQITMF